MSEFVRKAMMGYKEVPGGYEDQECTHVILTKQEYADQLREVNQARREAQSTKYNASREIQEMRREAQAKIAAGEATAAKTIADLESALAAEQEESALQRRLNANLLRIARERANADRRFNRPTAARHNRIHYARGSARTFRLGTPARWCFGNGTCRESRRLRRMPLHRSTCGEYIRNRNLQNHQSRLGRRSQALENAF